MSGYDARSIGQRIDAAEDEVFRRFQHPDFGYLLDYAGLDGAVDFPTPDDMAMSRPNGMSWWSPVENGSFFTGLMLAGLADRKQRPDTAERARTLAEALLRLATVGKRRGFIARSVASDGTSHPIVGSDDQTIPWLYGLWRYLRSDLPTPPDRERIIQQMIAVCEALRETGWQMPIDGPPSFGFRGSWSHFNFVHAPRLLFAHRIMAELDRANAADWLRLYYERLAERDHNSGPSRLELCAAGAEYLYPGSRISYPKNPPFWISAASQAVLRELHDLEEDATVRANYACGLAANSAGAGWYVSQHRWFDNDEPTPYRLDWRFLNHHWDEQRNVDEALTVANNQRPFWFRANPRKVYEEHTMREPLWAAWIVMLDADASSLRQTAPDIAAALHHYRWDRLYSSTFFITTLLDPDRIAEALQG